jgi:Amt family ammonium transporter
MDSTPALEFATARSLNELWVLVCAELVFFMQGGFLCLEAGCVSERSVRSIAMKNLIDWLIVVLVFGLVGFGFTSCDGVLFGRDSSVGDFGSGLWLVGFNGGSLLEFSSGVPLVILNTLLGAAAGGTIALWDAWRVRARANVEMGVMGGVLGGCVAVTASAP